MDPRDPTAALDGSPQRICVMGLGRFGGGAGAVRWLVEQGADVLLTDQASADELAGPLADLADLIDAGAVQLRLGGHNVSDFTDCDGVIVNPAVPRPWDNRFVRAAQAAGVPVTTEIELVIRRLPTRRRVIGVTGTAGKSTTSALIAHGLRQLGFTAHLGGNIGGSLLRQLGDVGEGDWVVLELSSAMLHWLSAGSARDVAARIEPRVPWSPHIAVVTNLAPNHLDWHGDAAHYEQSKRAIVREQSEGDSAILGPGVEHWETSFGVHRLMAPPEAAVEGLAIPGRHNAFNAAVAAAAIGQAAPEIGAERVAAALRSFAGLPHRLEFVGEERGVRFYNDSKSTTPEASARAVEALHESLPQAVGRIHLIAGGYDKQVDLSLLSQLATECAGLYTIGATGAGLADGPGERFECGDLDRAFARATERARAGDIVLLSPGCASWDQFENFEQRGRMFCDLARAWMEA